MGGNYFQKKIKAKNSEYERIWVHSSFKNQLKSEAALNGKKLIDYTEELASKKKKNEKFDFKF